MRPTPIFLAAALVLGTAAASAQETMKFERVSPESAAAQEERRAERRARYRVPGVEIDVPVPPDAPEPPVVVRSGDVVRIGSDIHIEKGQQVEGDVFALRGDITVDGHVKGNVASTGGDVHLGSTAKVDGDVMCIGGQLTEDPGSFVGGQRVTAMGKGRISDRISDKIRDKIEERQENRWNGHGRSGAIGFSFSWLLMTLLGAWAVAKLAPERTRIALDRLQSRPGTSLGIGFLGVLLLGPSLVALALAMAILCITIVGIPLALLLLPAYGVLLMMVIIWGFALGACTVGEQVRARWVKNAPATLTRYAVLGAVTLGGLLLASSILRALPFLGWLSTLVWVLGWVSFALLTMAGAGALLGSKFGQGPGGRWWPPFKSTPKPPAPAAAPSPATAPSAPMTQPPPEPQPPAAPIS